MGSPLDDRSQRVLNHLESNGPCTAAELQQTLGFERQPYGALRRLEVRDLVERSEPNTGGAAQWQAASTPEPFEMAADIREMVRRTIEQHTKGPQSETVAVSSIRLGLANHADYNLSAVNDAIDELAADGVIAVEDGRIRLLED